MGKHLVLGNGGIGRSTAQVLRNAGHDVTIGSRSGRPTGLDDVRSLAVECTDPAALAAAADGVDSIVNALNPKQYTHWDRDWPPMAQAVLAAAQRSGAGFTVTNPADGIQYAVQPDGLTLSSSRGVDREPAVEYGSG